MSRRRAAERREILPDPKFGNLQLARFINMVMKSGKKSVAERIIYGALDQIQDPHSFGGVARSAAGLGAAGILFPERRHAQRNRRRAHCRGTE